MVTRYVVGGPRAGRIRNREDHCLRQSENSRQANIALDLVEMYQQQRGRCHYLDVPLNLVPGDFRVSIERLDNDMGYLSRKHQTVASLMARETKVDLGNVRGAQHVGRSQEFEDRLWPRKASA